MSDENTMGRGEEWPPGAAERPPSVSVIVPSYNAQATIADCLTSILRQQTSIAYEVIVVDSSTDATPRIIRQRFPQITLVHQDRRARPAEARNIGVDRARAPLIAFIDADCLASPDWIEAIARAHETNPAAVGGAVRPAKPMTIPGALLFAIEFSEYVPCSSPRSIRWLPSLNLSVKRAMLETHGLFPADAETSEDIIWSRSLKQRSGAKLLFDPRIRVEHINRNDWRDYLRRVRTLGYGSGQSRRLGIVPGGFLVRHPALIPLLVPYRFLVILKRLLLGSGTKWLFGLGLLLAPLLVYGLIHWAIGFRAGTRPVGHERKNC
jgi:glycosyltransferase involved in cell wall biosynthesis